MQRDMKIGMALGVALVGIVGALFFRREPPIGDDKNPPPLPKAEQLDQEIAEKARTPYIQGLEEFDAPSVPMPPANGSARPNSVAKSDKANGKDDAKSRDMASGKAAGIPDPLRAIKPDSAPVDLDPSHNRDWEPTGPSAVRGKKTGDAPGTSPPSSITGTGRTHVIRPGDTLSGLASRYLGSSARFREIYEANRDQLRSADDVREGMTLKIPDAGKPREGQSAAETADVGRSSVGQSGTKSTSRAKARPISTANGEDSVNADSSPAVAEPSSDASQGKARFVPVPRGPFSAGRVKQPEAK